MSEKFDEELYEGATPLETPVEDVSVLKSSRYRPATELDFDPEGRKGLLPVAGETVAENIESLPERIQTSLEARTEESKRVEEERLREAGRTGPTAIKTETDPSRKISRPPNIPAFDYEAAQKAELEEAEGEGELTVSGFVKELLLTPQAFIAGVGAPTEKDLAKMTSEERRKYEESLNFDIYSGAMAFLPAVYTLGSLATEYVGQPISDAAKTFCL